MQSSSDRGLGLPDTVLTELWRAQVPPEAFAAVLGAFGELPEEGQKELALRVISASEVYRLRKLIEKHQFPRRHEHQRHLGRITTSAKHLLALLGIDEAK